MRIVVCVKPVKADLVYPNEMCNEEFLMNPYDLYALKKCIDYKNQFECTVICICMGPISSKYLLTKALAMDADEVVLLNDNVFIGSDTLSTSYILSQTIKKLGNIDVVVCGEKSIDGETGQVVYGISERLKYYCIPGVEQFLDAGIEHITLKKKENDITATVRVKLPVVISFNDFLIKQPNINLLALKRAKNKEITIWNASDIEADTNKCGTYGSKTQVINIKSEINKKRKVVVEGTAIDKANLIIGIVNRKVIN